MDGKHVTIVPPPGAGLCFFNYEGYNSQVLIGISDSNYEFIYFNIGTNGRVSDGGVSEYTDFYDKLQNECLKITESSDVKERKLPCFFVGDEEFSFRKDFLRPYNVKQLKRERKIFNYRLSRARRIIENVFGILVARFGIFGIFKTHINMQLDNIKYAVMASCALHNFLRRISPDTYTPSECFDVAHLENDTVTVGLRSHPSSVATLKRGNNRNHQLTGKEERSLWNTSTTKGKCRGKTTVYKEIIYQKPLLLIYFVHTAHILYEYDVTVK